MSLTVVGSVALDTVETPSGRNEDGLGGAAVYFSLAATNYTDVHLVGVVGEDFPDEHVDLLSTRGINMDGLERVEGITNTFVQLESTPNLESPCPSCRRHGNGRRPPVPS